MHLNLKLHLTSDFCSKSWQVKETIKTSVPAGSLEIQSYSHYIAHVEVINYSLSNSSRIDFLLQEPAYLMVISLDKNSCRLIYQPAGICFRTIPPGVSTLMVISFRPEWLIHKCGPLPEMEALIKCFSFPEARQVILPTFNIGKSLFNLLKKTTENSDVLNRDTDGYLFISACINKYCNKLISKKKVSLYHQDKAIAIADFIRENYASTLVDDLPKLAKQFMTSERNLARLARMAFGVPLHTQVIKIRMGYGLNHLLNTDMPINEISKAIGYSEPCYFSKAFKKHFGISPRLLGER